MTALIEADRISAGYGPGLAIREVSLRVEAGQVVALLGPNGSGKTTTLLTLAGELDLRAGSVRIDGVVSKAPFYQRARAGMSFVTEDRAVFRQMTVRDNFRVGGCRVEDSLPDFPELEPLILRRGGTLSGGEQQIVAVARALARRPRVLLADELSLGLAPLVVRRLLGAIRSAADKGLGVLLVEQHVQDALAVSDWVYVLRRGTVVMEGSAREMATKLERVMGSYLSEGDETEVRDGAPS